MLVHRTLLPLAIAILQIVIARNLSAQCLYEASIIFGPACGDQTDYVLPRGIGPNGVIVGTLRRCGFSGNERPFWWDGQLHVVDTGGVANHAELVAINESGVMVGSHDSENGNQSGRRFLYVSQGGVFDIAVPSDTQRGQFEDINDKGQVVGWMETKGRLRGIVWFNGAFDFLEDRVSDPPMMAKSISSRGVI